MFSNCVPGDDDAVREALKLDQGETGAITATSSPRSTEVRVSTSPGSSPIVPVIPAPS